MKNCSMILTEKLQKHPHYHSKRLINMNVLQMTKYYLQIQMIEQAKLTYCPLGTALQKQT